MRKIKIYRGHGVVATMSNIGLALITLVYVLLRYYIKFYISNNYSKIGIWMITGMIAILYAYPTYLFMELKHIIFKDQRLRPLNAGYISFFGIQSLIGLVIQIIVVVGLIKVYNNNNIALLLSFLAAFGGCIGLTDLIFTLWIPDIVKHTWKVILNKRMLFICIGTTLIIYLSVISCVSALELIGT